MAGANLPGRRRPAPGRVRRLAFLCAGLAGMLLAMPPGAAHANFIEQMAIDARAIALANTVTADPPGISAIHYNPAGLSLLPEGKYFSSGMTVPIIKITSAYDADPDFEGFFGDYDDDPLNGTEGTNSSGRMYLPIINQEADFLVAPMMGLSYRPAKSRWAFGVGNYVPFGVGFSHADASDPVRYGAKYAYMQHLVYLAPAVSYKLSDKLSAGLTVGVGQTAVGVGLDMRSPNDLVSLTRVLGDATEELEIPVLSELTMPPPWFGGGIGPYDQVASLQMAVRDDFSPNYNVGLLYEPSHWFSLGMVYQSPIKVQLTGNYRFDYTEEFQSMINWMGSSPNLLMVSGMLNLPFNAVPYQSGTVTAELEFPQRVQTGIKIKPFKRLSLMADVAWANWSCVKEDRFIFDQDIQLLQLVKVLGYTGGNNALVLKRDFKDTWSWSVGLEFQLTDWLSLMLGYERRPTSVSEYHFDNIYSLPDLDNYGAGFSIKLKNGTQIDLGFAYLVNTEYCVPNNTSDLLNSTDSFEPVYNPYAGLDYTQKTETYIGSFKVSMPLTVMSAMVDKTLSLLNPFGGHKKHHGAVRPVPSETPFSPAPPPAAGACTLELARYASAERARMALEFYRADSLTPELRAVRASDNGGVRWALQIGRFPSPETAEAFRRSHNLAEADIRPLTEAASQPLHYCLRLAVSDAIERARLTAEFYRSEGVSARVMPVEQGFAVVAGDFDTDAGARRFAEEKGLVEAEVVPCAK